MPIRDKITEHPTSLHPSEPVLVIDTGGHMAKIWDVIFTSDGRYLVSASEDKTVRVWDVSTAEVVRVLRSQIGRGNEGTIYAMAISPNDRLLAVGGWMAHGLGIDSNKVGDIRLIDLQAGEVVALLRGHANVVLGLAISPDGSRLISGGVDKTARIWDVHSRSTLHVLKGHKDYIYAVAFSPDGTQVVTGSDDNTLRLWKAKSGELITTLRGHEAEVRSAAFTPDGRYLLSGGKDKSIRLWDGRTGKFIKVLAKQNRTVDSLSISIDGTKLVTGHGPGHGKRLNNVFSIPSGEGITSFAKHPNIALATAISPDGKTVATGGVEGEIYLWDILSGESKQKMHGNGKMVWSVGFSRNGRSIAWGKTSKRRNLFNRGPLEQAFQIKGEGSTFDLALNRELKGDSGYLRGMESVGPWSIMTKNGKIGPTLRILKNETVVYEITRHSTSGYDHRSLTLTPDGRAVISGGANGRLASYDPRTGEKVHDFIGHRGEVWGVAVSSDSTLLVSGSADQTVKLWDISAGKLLLTIFRGTDNEWVAWTPEGYYTASVNGDKYVGWHINRGEDKSALYYPASRFSKQFYSRDIVARYLETRGDIDEAIRLVNAEKPMQKRVKDTAVSGVQRLVPPAVFFQTPSQREVTVSTNSIRVAAQARSLTKEPIIDIWLLVNGRRVERSRGIKVTGREHKKIEGLRAEIDLIIPLTQEENRISVMASNRHAQSEPEIIYVRWKREGPAKGTEPIYKPDLYLFAIGVSRYQDPEYTLGFAHKDATGVATFFERQGGMLYKEVHKRVLTNHDASRENILDGLDWILKESTQKDLSVIFVAGHGLKDERGNYYFLPHDGNPKRLRQTGIKWFDFQDVLTSLPSKIIFMVDTCHSGGATGKRRGVSDMTDALRELVHAESGVVVMTASTGKEVSQERAEWGHGAFTRALIEGLEGRANYNKDNTIDIKELDLYITNRVKELTGGAQHPTTEIPKTMPNFPVVYKKQ
jgi:WD40 repeat protein